LKIIKIDSLDDYDTYIYIHLVYEVLCNISVDYTYFKNFLKNYNLPPNIAISCNENMDLVQITRATF
jgi:hypothetical protein